MIRRFAPCLVAVACLLSSPLRAQDAGSGIAVYDAGEASFVINLRDAEIQELSERVSEITGRTLILDPAIEGRVTVISSEPLDADGVWQLFQSVLLVQGYAALRSGDIWRIVPQAKISQGVAALDTADAAFGQDIVTRTIVLQNLRAAEAVAAMRPLVAPFGTLQALASPNAIVITDSADNVARMQRLVARLDRDKRGQVETLQLQFAKAVDVAESIIQVIGNATAAGGRPGPQVSANAGTNTLLVRGEPDQIAEVGRLVAQLDRPQIVAAPAPVALPPLQTLTTIPLRFARARDVAQAVQAVISQSSPVPVAPSAPAMSEDGTVAVVAPVPAPSGPGPRVSFDERSNTLLVRATPATLAEIRDLVAVLDTQQAGAISLVTIPLQYGDAASIAEAIQATVADPAALATGKVPARISADTRSNTLIVRADPVSVGEIRALVRTLDRRQTDTAGLVTIPLRNGDATAIAASIQSIVGDPAAEAAGQTPARVSGDPRSNTLIVRADPATVAQIRALAAQLDGAKPADTAVIPLRFAEAANVAEALNAIGGTAPDAPTIAVDARGNALLVRGDPLAVASLRGLAGQLDQPGAATPRPVTRVYRLRHTDAEAVATILREIVGLEQPATTPVAAALEPDAPDGRLSGLAAAATGQGTETALDAPDPALARDAPARRSATDRRDAPTSDIAIQPDPDGNAIVLRGTPRAVEQTVSLIAELDRRRPQVLIEAAIVEVTGVAGEQLGIQFGFGDAVPDAGVAATSFSNGGVSLQGVLSVLGVPAAGLLSDGLTLGASVGNDFGILLQALATSSSANLLSTPSLTTLDNQEAEIVVGQNVPFRTGSFTIDGNSADPFTTIQREDVGITLRVLPRVHEGDVVRLKVAQEVSSLVNANVPGAADLITNRRSIDTTVLADNGETVVLGGLITDDQLTAERKVPLLGDIPVAGRLFRSDSVDRTKRTLFVFLRPTILRDRTSVARVSREKYERLRLNESIRTIVPGTLIDRPALAPLPLEIDGLY